MLYAEVLESELRSARLELPASTRKKLVRYCEELTRWNEKINLTGLHGAELVRRLVVEPIWIGRQLEISGVVVDIGSGNGSPAIPIAISRQLERVHLVEARTRRAVFLRHISSMLKLESIEVHQALFEEISTEMTPVDWVTMQGVAPTRNLCRAIRSIAKPATNVVWITSGDDRVEERRILSRVIVPFTNTRVLLLNLEIESA